MRGYPSPSDERARFITAGKAVQCMMNRGQVKLSLQSLNKFLRSDRYLKNVTYITRHNKSARELSYYNARGQCF